MIRSALLAATLSTLLAGPACARRGSTWGAADGIHVTNRLLLTDQGGRVSWCHADDLIAFDREADDGSMDVFTIRPDGTDERCLTCDTPDLPRGIRGQPDWHPSCDYLLVVAQSPHHEGTRYEHVAWGINDDLWLVAADGSWATRLLETPPQGAVLHPHFSDTGDQVFWAARAATGETVPQLLAATPGDENPWDGWFLSVADFVPPVQPQGPALTQRVDLFTDQSGFYESHALHDGVLYFSHTDAAQPFIDEGYAVPLDRAVAATPATLEAAAATNLTASPGTWEEHVDPSPDGTLIAFNSSRHTRWSHPPDLAITLRMDIWLRTPDGDPIRLTRYNDLLRGRNRAITSDFAWGPDSRHIVTYRGELGHGSYQQFIEVLTLAIPD